VWSVTYFQGPPAGRDAQHGIFTEYSIVPETERSADPLGIWAAEFGHQQGFPDMFYSTESTTMAKTGHWELESLGAWDGTPAGSSPAYTLTINQENRGWLQGNFIQVYTQATHGVGNGTATIQLTEVELNKGNMSIEVITSGHAAFYWIEARKQVGWDKGIPENGVLIGTINHSVGFDASAFKLMNAHPSDPTLNNAAFQVGQTYKDSFITIAIESYANGVYSINIT
jgi:M6 family metalloprotease-like protein